MLIPLVGMMAMAIGETFLIWYNLFCQPNSAVLFCTLKDGLARNISSI